MKKALLICYSFPPSTHSNAKRTGLVATSLVNAGWSVDVLSSSYEVGEDQRETLSRPCLSIKRLDSWYESSLRGNIKRPTGIRLILEKTLSLVTWPDKRVPWIKRINEELSDSGGYELIIVSIVPIASLLLASWRKDFDRRWVLDYQEPVSPELMLYPSHLPMHRFLFKHLLNIEKTALQRCGIATFSCEMCRKAYVAGGLVERGKTHVVAHSYDPECFTDHQDVPEGKFDIVYTGSFHGAKHGDRSPKAFFQSFRLFLDKNPDAAHVAKIIIYGKWLKEHDTLIEEYDLTDHLQIRPPISGPEYYKVLQSSTVLLLITSARHNLHLPGKLVDYLGAKRPVLAFVPRGSEASVILNECGFGCYSVLSNDGQDGAEVLEKLWHDIMDGRYFTQSDKAVKWSSTVQMKTMIKHISDLVK